MSKADYSFKIENHYRGFDFLLIEDKNLGNCSVTNYIENIVEEIAFEQSIDNIKYVILYMDSESDWDGWDPILGFFSVGGKTSEEAMDNYIKRYR